MDFSITPKRLKKGLKDPVNGAEWLKSYVLERIFTATKQKQLFSEDWDLAIILDACRYDLARDVADQYDLPEPDRVYSSGWTSEVWLRRTFSYADSQQLEQTAYITGNQYSEVDVPKKELAVCDEVWKYQWDSDLGTVPPRPITNRTIQLAREGAADRYIAHYMQPHLPPIIGDYSWAGGIDVDENVWRDGSPWDRVTENKINENSVIEAYNKNIHPVLEDVMILLDNIDADTAIITADHGNFLGENDNWGHFGANYYHQAVRDVPWWETYAEDNRSHIPKNYDREQTSERNQQLKALGYK